MSPHEPPGSPSGPAAWDPLHRELFGGAADAILVHSADGRILEANPAAEALFGRLRDELVGRPITTLFETGLDQAPGDGWLATRAIGPNGMPVAVECSAVAVDREGDIEVVLRTRSIAERRQTDDALVAAQKMGIIGSLVGGVRHEINNPLTAVRGYAELIAMDPSVSAATREDAGRIRESGEKALALVGAFADFALDRPQVREPFALGEIVGRVLALLRFDFMQPLRPRSSSGVVTTVDVSASLPRAVGDPGRTAQVLVSLVQNSLDAFRAEAAGHPDPVGVVGRIEITACVAGGLLCCRVADDGPGIPDQIRERLFQPFVSTRSGGRGLGLWASARLAAASGGSLELEPTEQGAAFVLALPFER
jgi:signal transduction histidine kinase